MVAFTVQEHLAVEELNPEVKQNVQTLAQLTGQFADTQKALEGDDFGTGSRFIGTLRSLTHLVGKLEYQQPAAVESFQRQIDDFKSGYYEEYHFLLMMTYLDHSMQFVPGRTCSEFEFGEMRAMLEQLVTEQVSFDVQEEAEVAAEPGSDDFCSYINASRTQTISPADQIVIYGGIRAAQFHVREFWRTASPEIQRLAKVAIRVLSSLTTSASVERSFSIARQLCGDSRMAMKQDTISSRVMIQAN
jgi:hypothetical protein